MPDGKILIACYHPSPRNVNTKVINLKMMKNLFIKAKKLNQIFILSQKYGLKFS